MSTSKFVKHSPLAAGVVTFIVSSLFGATQSNAAIINGGFETGEFNGFKTKGDTSIQTSEFFKSGPTEGSFQALVATTPGEENFTFSEKAAVPALNLEKFLGLEPGSLNALGNGNAVEGSAIKKTFTANAGDFLSFDFNFLTDEETPNPVNNDFSFFTIAFKDSPALAFELADTASPTFKDSSTPFLSETGFQTFSKLIETAGKYVVGFGVVDVFDKFFSSGLLVDNIKLTPGGSCGKRLP